MANEINRGLAEVFDAVDIPKISGIKVVSPKSAQGKKAFSGADAVASYNFAEKGIFLNKDLLKDMEAWQKHVDESREAFDYVIANRGKLTGARREIADRYAEAGRSLVEGDTIAGAIKHELGHHVDWSVFGAKGNPIRNAWKEHAGNISGYAGFDKREYMAESFVAWLNGEERAVAPEYARFLEGKVKSTPIGSTGTASVRNVGDELRKKAFKLRGREAATVLSAIDSNPGRFANKKFGSIAVDIEGKGCFEYDFMRTEDDEILFLERTRID